MTHVLTLIGAPGAATLTETVVEATAGVLPGELGEPVWLAPGEACDIPFTPDEETGFDAALLELVVRNTLDRQPVDIAVQPVAGRRKQLLIADMDSTIIGQECIDEIADLAGLKAKIAAITDRAMRGELEFASALRERVALLTNLEEAVLQRVIDERITLTPGARALVQTMRAHGAYCCLVSGGFTFFTSRIAAMTGFDAHQANDLEIVDGRLTGKVREPILGQDAKLEALRRFRTERGVASGETLAVGDGANDLAMIAEAGLGVAYRAKPVVAQQADVRIEYGDLTALLHLQGYERAAFRD